MRIRNRSNDSITNYARYFASQAVRIIQHFFSFILLHRAIDRYWFIAMSDSLDSHLCDHALAVIRTAKVVIKTRLITEHYPANEGNDRCARV